MAFDYRPPRPVIGLVVCGAILILLEGLLELGLVAISSSAITLPGAIVAIGFAISGFTIALAAVILLLAWVYAGNPSGLIGVVFIVLGAFSFLVGAGFDIGGILIVVGGALAVFAEWIGESFAPNWVTTRVPYAQSSPSVGVPPPPPPSPPPGPPERTRGAVWTPPRTGGIVIYRTCPRCGELVPRDAPACSRCGGSFPHAGGSGLMLVM